jgi:ATP-dependent DNA ligase
MYLATLPKAVRFDHIKGIDSRTKEQRYESFKLYGTNSRIIDDLNDIAVLETQYTSIDEVFQAYDQAIISGYEGLVMMHKNSSYKMGRHSLNSGMAYKIKEDNLQFDGVTVARRGYRSHRRSR